MSIEFIFSEYSFVFVVTHISDEYVRDCQVTFLWCINMETWTRSEWDFDTAVSEACSGKMKGLMEALALLQLGKSVPSSQFLSPDNDSQFIPFILQ